MYLHIFSSEIDLLYECTPVPMHVCTLVDDPLMVHQVYRSCLVLLNSHVTWVDMIILNMFDFYIILGMDWLSPHQAILDCYTKTLGYNR